MSRQPDRIRVSREGGPQWVLIEPNHPRFSASLDRRVKRAFTEEGRYRLCERLQPHFQAALQALPEDPVLACLGEDTFALFRRDGKVRVEFL